MTSERKFSIFKNLVKDRLCGKKGKPLCRRPKRSDVLDKRAGSPDCNEGGEKIHPLTCAGGFFRNV